MVISGSLTPSWDEICFVCELPYLTQGLTEMDSH